MGCGLTTSVGLAELLRDVINCIADHKITRIDELLPWSWGKAAGVGVSSQDLLRQIEQPALQRKGDVRKG